jgi:SPP1 gp7 family putative phage head morphogenesis protein
MATTNFLWTPVPNEEAAAFLGNKRAVSRQVFDGLLPELRARAFVISGIEDHDVLQNVRDAIAEIPRGADWEATKEEVLAKISPWLVTATDPEERAEQLLAANQRANLLLRVHGMQSYGAAAYRDMDAQRDVFSYWKYQSMDDSRVRGNHAALDGIILPHDSPFWRKHFPPWEFGCRCTAVPMLPEEVDEIRAEESKLPKWQRRVVEGGELKRLEEEGTIVRPMKAMDGQTVAHTYTVKAPSDTNPKKGYLFDPGSLTMNVSDLKGRYAPEVFQRFEDRARKEVVGKDPATGKAITTWEWLTGAKLAPAQLANPSPAPAAAPGAVAPPRSHVPHGVSVSTAADIAPKMMRAEKAKAKATFDAIDSIHGDGALGITPIHNKVSPKSDGTYWGGAGHVAFKRKNPGAEFHLAHEIGHWLDHKGITSPTAFASNAASDPTSPLHGWWQAVTSSKAYGDIKSRPTLSKKQAEYQEYQLRPAELWARCYAQFITVESRQDAMVDWLKKVRTGSTGYPPESQWEDQDFEPIRNAMKDTFVKLGWMKTQTTP